MSAKNLHSAYAVERRKSDGQDSFVGNLSWRRGESVRLQNLTKAVVDDLRFVHTSEDNYIVLFISTLHVDVTKL